MADDGKILASLEASPARRWFAVGCMAAMGGLLIYIALAQPPEPIWQAFLLAMGALTLVIGERLRRSTAQRLELTRDALRSSDGRIVARLDAVEKVDRGVFAFKPSNGFLLKLTTAHERHWAPGLWWRVGRRVGVGGVTSRGQAKAMAEVMDVLLAERATSKEP